MAHVRDPEEEDGSPVSLEASGISAHDALRDHGHSTGHGYSNGPYSDGSVGRRQSTTGSEDSDDTQALSTLDHTPSRGAEAFQEITHVRTTTSIGSCASRPPDFEVVFEDGDGCNPRDWSLWYRTWVTVSISFTTWVVVFYSTAYTAAIPGLMEEFGVTNPTVVTLGVTTYLLGLAVGSLLVAPASELYGRRPVYIVCMICFTLLVIPCCLATSLTQIIVVRFFCAVFGSVMVSNSAGTVVDISTEEYRALVMSLWSIAPMNGPTTGPIIGGFVYQSLGWRWECWLTLILGSVGTLCMVFTKETYAPTLLRKKAAGVRKEQDDDRWWCRYDEQVSPIELLRVSLLRPFVLAFTEPILWFFNIWISLTYGILYLCFVAYPIVFTQNRGWGPGIAGLAFVGIGVGIMICICCEPFWRRLINSHPKDPATGKVPPEASARVMIIGAILTASGQLIFSWTCLPASIHWAIPIAAGVPFGLGNGLSFIYGANYLAGAYGIYAASALAGNAVMRSAFGGTLPLAGPSMYAALTPQWAGTLLGLLEVCLIPIPIIFYKYGERIRAKSPAIKFLREDQEKNERRAARAQRTAARRHIAAQTAAAAAGGEGDGAARGQDDDGGSATASGGSQGLAFGDEKKKIASSSIKDLERGIPGADGEPPVGHAFAPAASEPTRSSWSTKSKE